jgi:DNA-binding transcriptional regulator YhcF (GntR family)
VPIQRRILKILPATREQIQDRLNRVNPESIRKTLQRMRQAGIVTSQDGIYRHPKDDEMERYLEELCRNTY